MRKQLTLYDDGPSLVLCRLFDEIRMELRSGSPTMHCMKDFTIKTDEIHSMQGEYHIVAEDEEAARAAFEVGNCDSYKQELCSVEECTITGVEES